MKISKNVDLADGSSCELWYDEAEDWLRATWLGFVDPEEAYRGAVGLLETLQEMNCPYLLNDNSQLRGPWFDSIEWLATVWAPQAERMGLRCIAHVAQPHDLLSQAAALVEHPLGNQIRLQLFDDVATAETWLRQQQTQP